MFIYLLVLAELFCHSSFHSFCHLSLKMHYLATFVFTTILCEDSEPFLKQPGSKEGTLQVSLQVVSVSCAGKRNYPPRAGHLYFLSSTKESCHFLGEGHSPCTSLLNLPDECQICHCCCLTDLPKKNTNKTQPRIILFHYFKNAKAHYFSEICSSTVGASQW